MLRDATPAPRLDSSLPSVAPSLVRTARTCTPASTSRHLATSVVTVLAPHERVRVDAAGDGCYVTTHRESLDEVFEDLRHCRADAILLSVARCDPRSASHVARMVREFPAVPAVALLSETTPHATQAVLVLGQYGVRSLVDVRDPGGWHALRQLLGTRQGGHIVRRSLDRIERELPDAPEDMRRFLDGCFLAPPRIGTVRALSRRLGVGASTLMSRFYRAGLPAPKRYLAYARLVKAAALFENPGLSVSQVAHALEYSSPQSFGRHIQTMLDLTALRFRQQHDGASMLEQFVDDLITPWSDLLTRFSPLVVQPLWLREADEQRRALHATTASGGATIADASAATPAFMRRPRRVHDASPEPRVMPRPGRPPVRLLSVARPPRAESA